MDRQSCSFTKLHTRLALFYSIIIILRICALQSRTLLYRKLLIGILKPEVDDRYTRVIKPRKMVSTKVSEVRSTNWSGMIPIELSLAPTSLSSPTMPPPIHIMVSRQTYFHVGLQNAVMRLYKFAPPVLSFRNMAIRNEPDPGEDSGDDMDVTGLSTAESATESSNPAEPLSKTTTPDYPVCWFEDEETHIALRWHLFVGVLYDLNLGRSSKKLPWKIRLHFSGYPNSQILPLDDSSDGVWTTVERTFKNSLKQALFLQHGSSKVAMGMTKQSHERIWDSIVTTNYQLYQQVNSDLQAEPKTGDELRFLPVRLLVDAKPPIQRPCRVCIDTMTDTGTLFRSQGGVLVS